VNAMDVALRALTKAWGIGLTAAAWEPSVRAAFAAAAVRRRLGRPPTAGELAAVLQRIDTRGLPLAAAAYTDLARFVLRELAGTTRER